MSAACRARCDDPWVTWQLDLRDELVGRLPASATHWTTGSVLVRDQLDQWSDLDLHVDLGGLVEPIDLFAGLDVWAASEDMAAGPQVLRLVLRDGRRVDLIVEGGGVQTPAQAADNDIRMIAALAAAKLGRGDLLIGLHLTLDLMRSCLVQAMLLRDRDLGTRIHRFGSVRDTMADEVAELVSGPVHVSPRPNIVERTVELYGRWRRELDPVYVPDWSGLDALLSRGLATA
jgi:hypothetical protein